MSRKLLICPFFGPLPPWWHLYEPQIQKLHDCGYDFLLDFNLDRFKTRVYDRLGVHAPIREGQGKIHDYRCTFGILYEDELQGYDFWGHTDFDCVYGRPDHFLTDEVLADVDIHADHHYVCGPWSLYRNTPAVNEAFYAHEDWRGHLENPAVTGWVETSYTEIVKASGLRVLFTGWHTYEAAELARLRWWPDGVLTLDGRERLMAHFRRTKMWPKALA